MTLISPGAADALSTYGYGAVALAVGIESVGVPFPGETTLLAAAIYAATSHRLDITLVVAAASLGAILGDNIGFWLGRELGFRVLLRFGNRIRMTPARIKLGQYLFQRYGAEVVFFGRFVALLRALAAFLAGANEMTWTRFLFFNAAGGIVWASLYGFGAYFLGRGMERLAGPVGIGLGIAVVAAIGVWMVFLHQNEQRLTAEAERMFPGPVRARPWRRRRRP
jgi:membrane protein DedA with SNARE-associated domain